MVIFLLYFLLYDMSEYLFTAIFGPDETFPSITCCVWGVSYITLVYLNSHCEGVKFLSSEIRLLFLKRDKDTKKLTAENGYVK